MFNTKSELEKRVRDLEKEVGRLKGEPILDRVCHYCNEDFEGYRKVRITLLGRDGDRTISAPMDNAWLCRDCLTETIKKGIVEFD